jgi:hypothetical protein
VFPYLLFQKSQRPSPEGVNVPLFAKVHGWDVFSDGKFVAEGVDGGMPRFETPERVRSWVEAEEVKK